MATMAETMAQVVARMSLLEGNVTVLQEEVAAAQHTADSANSALDISWVILCGTAPCSPPFVPLLVYCAVMRFPDFP